MQHPRTDEQPGAARRLDAFTEVLDGHGSLRAIAGAGARSVAALIDLGIVLVPVGAALLIGEVTTGGLAAAWTWGILLGGTPLLLAAYALLFELFSGGETIGKNLTGLRVVSADGRPASTAQLLLRNAVRLVDWLPLLYGAGAAVHTLSGSRRLGDLAAGTVVVFDEPLRMRLLAAGASPAAYSTSEDEYLLDSFLDRCGQMPAEVTERIAHRIAQHLHRTYPPTEAALTELYRNGRFREYLMEIHRLETEAARDAE